MGQVDDITPFADFFSRHVDHTAIDAINARMTELGCRGHDLEVRQAYELAYIIGVLAPTFRREDMERMNHAGGPSPQEVSVINMAISLRKSMNTEQRDERSGSELPEEVRAVFRDLDILSRLPSAHKLVVETMDYVFVGSWISSVLSSLTRRESGHDTVAHINNLITKAIQAAVRFPCYRGAIEQKLAACRTAVVSLKQVYANKPTIAGDLTTIIELRLAEARVKSAIQRMTEQALLGADGESGAGGGEHAAGTGLEEG